MEKFNSICTVFVHKFVSEKAKVDKNGKDPVKLRPIAGRCIDANVISGTSAEVYGFELGKSYVVAINEVDAIEKDGKSFRQFKFTNLGEAGPIELMKIGIVPVEIVNVLPEKEVVKITNKEEIGELSGNPLNKF